MIDRIVFLLLYYYILSVLLFFVTPLAGRWSGAVQKCPMSPCPGFLVASGDQGPSHLVFSPRCPRVWTLVTASTHTRPRPTPRHTHTLTTH